MTGERNPSRIQCNTSDATWALGNAVAKMSWFHPTGRFGYGWRETAVSTGPVSTTQCHVSTLGHLFCHKVYMQMFCVCLLFVSAWFMAFILKQRQWLCLNKMTDSLAQCNQISDEYVGVCNFNQQSCTDDIYLWEQACCSFLFLFTLPLFALILCECLCSSWRP